jgi:septal ring factor EnvC (AmiA/AmiB activator)
MAAQAQQNFPLSALFQILNLDGKDKILPVIQQNEHYQEMMMQMQQQLEQMNQQMQQMQKENQSLRTAVNTTTNALAQTATRRPQSRKMAQAGGDDETPNAIVESARNTLGVPTGMQLPT